MKNSVSELSGMSWSSPARPGGKTEMKGFWKSATFLSGWTRAGSGNRQQPGQMKAGPQGLLGSSGCDRCQSVPTACRLSRQGSTASARLGRSRVWRGRWEGEFWGVKGEGGRAGACFLECLAPGWVLSQQHFFNITYLFIWLHRVCAAVCGLSPVAASRGYRPGATCQPLIPVASLAAERWWAL